MTRLRRKCSVNFNEFCCVDEIGESQYMCGDTLVTIDRRTVKNVELRAGGFARSSFLRSIGLFQVLFMMKHEMETRNLQTTLCRFHRTKFQLSTFVL